MAKTKQQEAELEPKQETAPEVKQETAPEVKQETAPGSAPEPKRPSKPPKEGSPLLLILTVLLLLVGVSEVGLWGYYGFGVFRNAQAMRQYEQEQEELAREREARGAILGASYGPFFRVENGTVTWRREDDQPIAGGGALSGESDGLSQSGGGSGSDDDLPRITIPNIPYLLAGSGEEESQETAPPAGGTGTAT